MGIRINGSSGGYVELGVPANPSNRNVTLPDFDGEAVVTRGTSGATCVAFGTTADRSNVTPMGGDIRFNTDTGEMEFWAPNLSVPAWTPIHQRGLDPLNIEYLVVGGGASGAGYEPNQSPTYWTGSNGSNSQFDTVIAGGGGYGGHPNSGTGGPGIATNGSGGGGGYAAAGAAGDGTGGTGGTGSGHPNYHGGGGGGAGGNGANGGTGSSTAGDGGIGITTTIITAAQATANSVGEVDSGNVYFAGGGGGGQYTHHSTTSSNGGLGGGADSTGGMTTGGYGSSGTGNATDNTGGGGAGYPNASIGGGGGGAGGVVSGTLSNVSTGSAKPIVVGAGGPPQSGLNVGGGGSGVIILKYPSVYNASFTAGVTQTTITDGANKISFIKGTTNSSQTVTFS